MIEKKIYFLFSFFGLGNVIWSDFYQEQFLIIDIGNLINDESVSYGSRFW